MAGGSGSGVAPESGRQCVGDPAGSAGHRRQCSGAAVAAEASEDALVSAGPHAEGCDRHAPCARIAAKSGIPDHRSGALAISVNRL